MKIIKDLGMMYPNENSKHKYIYWIKLCPICKKERKVRSRPAKKGKVTRCKPCSNIMAKTTHGLTKTPLYKVWTAMKSRCNNSKNEMYKHYGGRGIIVCVEWMNSSTLFIEWAFKSGYSKGLSIERINNDGNYEPENCTFIPLIEQSRNKSIRVDNKTGYRGVTIIKQGRYRAQITYDGKHASIGCFSTATEAAIARNKYIDKFNLKLNKAIIPVANRIA